MNEQPRPRVAIFSNLRQAQEFSRAIFEHRRKTVPSYEPATKFYSAVEHEVPGPGNANQPKDKWYVPLYGQGPVATPAEAVLAEKLPDDWHPTEPAASE